MDMVFAARHVQKKCQKQNVSLYPTFVDLTIAFHTTCWEGLWTIMVKFGCPAKFISFVRQFYDGMQASVQDGGVYSEPFPVSNGVKQGCVVALTFFSVMFFAMLSDAFNVGDIGVGFRYRTDRKLFNLRRLLVKTKFHEDAARDFLYAGDWALNASTQLVIQESLDLFSKAWNDFGVTSTKK